MDDSCTVEFTSIARWLTMQVGFLHGNGYVKRIWAAQTNQGLLTMAQDPSHGRECEIVSPWPCYAHLPNLFSIIFIGVRHLFTMHLHVPRCVALSPRSSSGNLAFPFQPLIFTAVPLYRCTAVSLWLPLYSEYI